MVVLHGEKCFSRSLRDAPLLEGLEDEFADLGMAVDVCGANNSSLRSHREKAGEVGVGNHIGCPRH